MEQYSQRQLFKKWEQNLDPVSRKRKISGSSMNLPPNKKVAVHEKENIGESLKCQYCKKYYSYTASNHQELSVHLKTYHSTEMNKDMQKLKLEIIGLNENLTKAQQKEQETKTLLESKEKTSDEIFDELVAVHRNDKLAKKSPNAIVEDEILDVGNLDENYERANSVSTVSGINVYVKVFFLM